MKIENIEMRKQARLESLIKERDNLIPTRDRLRREGSKTEFFACCYRINAIQISICHILNPSTRTAEGMAKVNERSRAAALKVQQKTLAAQTAKYKPWTDDEDAFVMESDLTDFEIAIELGRTFHGVRSRRRDLRKNLYGRE